MTRRPVWLSWSSGKDSAWALQLLKGSADYEVTALVTTVTSEFDRVAMHGVRRVLLERQAQSAQLPLKVVELPYPCDNATYESRMAALVQEAVDSDVHHMAFGDLFLEDIRAYREKMLAGTGIEALFPLWQRDTTVLAGEMIDAGLGAYLTCVDPKAVPQDWAGRRFDKTLLTELPDGVDPCGEHGEFHTFAVAGPMFHEAIGVSLGKRRLRDGFQFADLLPDDEKTP